MAFKNPLFYRGFYVRVPAQNIDKQICLQDQQPVICKGEKLITQQPDFLAESSQATASRQEIILQELLR